MSDGQKIPTNTAEIIIGGEKKTINKLKAGKFYDAQTVFADIIKAITPPASIAQKKTPQSPQELAKAAQELGSEKLHEMFTIMPKKIAEFVAICADMEVKGFLDIAYPEEVPIAFTVCYKLNNVVENLKNYRAPMENLGAEVTKK